VLERGMYEKNGYRWDEEGDSRMYMYMDAEHIYSAIARFKFN
jgi:hypothetical protein